MDSDSKPKPIFSINLVFLRVSTLVLAFLAIISGSLGPYRYSEIGWQIPLSSFVISLMFTLVHWFGNNDKWLYKGYRRSTFIVLGFFEVVATFIWTILYAWLYEDSTEVAQRKMRYAEDDLRWTTRTRFLTQMILLYLTLVFSLLNAIGFAAMTLGLIRWLFVENKIMEKLRLGSEATTAPDVTSDRAFSISCSALRLLTLIAGAGSACLAYFFTCPPHGFDTIFIISASSCAISFVFLMIGWTGVLGKNGSWPILPQIIVALEIILSVLVALFCGILYMFCVSMLLSLGGEYTREPANSAVHGILALVEFNMLVFMILAYSLIRHLSVERKMAEKMQKLVNAEP